jgi:2-pyrone-4,6-dicarboxylate lactonase
MHSSERPPMTEPARPPRADSSRPRAAVPGGACDTHAHVFAPAGVYPYAPRRPYTPAPDTGLDAYRGMLGRIGFDRGVLVHSNIYGPDNRATTDALAAMAGAFRGIALIRPESDAGALAALAAVGMRGLRINLEFPGEVGLDQLEAMAPGLAGLGWHVQMLTSAERLPAIAARLRALPIEVVIDHMGLVQNDAELAGPGVRALLELLATGKLWVKLSAPYYADREAPAWPFASRVAGRLWQARPDRMLFGTNWPHPHADPVPDDGALVDWIAAVVGTEAGLRQILVDNPARLYGFADG